MRKISCLIGVAMMFVSSGCAGNMALSKGQQQVDLSERSVALASIKISNQNKPNYQPDLLYAFFDANSVDAEKTHISLKVAPYRSEKDKYNEYLLSFPLKPGRYTLSQIWGNYKIPVVINAICSVPLNAEIEIKANSIVYLGHIEAVIRERTKDSETRAGALVPIMDQTIAGFAGGTFDVAIEDKFDSDMNAYLAEYPVLGKVKVEKAIMPQWVRPELVTSRK